MRAESTSTVHVRNATSVSLMCRMIGRNVARPTPADSKYTVRFSRRKRNVRMRLKQSNLLTHFQLSKCLLKDGTFRFNPCRDADRSFMRSVEIDICRIRLRFGLFACINPSSAICVWGLPPQTKTIWALQMKRVSVFAFLRYLF